MHTQLLVVVSGAALAWAFYTAVYRVFLHPLAKIPGPKLAALTSLYESYYDLWLPGQYAFKIKRLHHEYGPVIRPVPDEVHVNDPDFLDTIYASRGRNNPNDPGLMIERSVAAAEDFHLHKMRRDALNPFFTQKFVLSMEDAIAEKCTAAIELISSGLATEAPVNLSDIYFAFSNDLVKNFCFGTDNDLLSDLSEANRQRISLMRLLTGVKFTRSFGWFIDMISSVLPAAYRRRAIPPAVTDLINFKNQAGQDIEAVLADVKDKNRGRGSVFYELRDNEDLPSHEKTVPRLQDEATILVMAGTESLAKSLQYASYYLLANPRMLQKLRDELSEARKTSADNTLDLPVLLGLPYLTATIQETNRLTFGVTNRMLRYSPTEALSYTATHGPHKGKSYVFPPGTRLSCLTWCTHTNEELFPEPLTFDPERFVGQTPEVTRRKKSLMAMGKGHRRCLGLNLANAAMALVLTRFVEGDLGEMELFETTYEDVEFKHDYQIAHPRLDTKGIRVVATQPSTGKA